MAEVFLSAADVARLTGVTPATVRYWTRTGRLPVAVQSESGIRLFRRADAERLLLERASGRAEHRRRG
jgi:DNA-binding transcriptional MerR regulator